MLSSPILTEASGQETKPGAPLLEAQSLSYSARGRQLVADVSFVLSAGRCLGIVGPNGAGKSTLLRLLSGYLTPARGAALLAGERVDRLPPHQLARRLSLVPQSSRADIDFTVFEMTLIGRYVHTRGWRETATDRRVAQAALAAAGVAHLRDRLFRTLSGGERQRVLLARALAQEPQVLLLDEPTANLDPRFQLAVLETVRRMACVRQMAVVVALHDLTLAARYCDELLLLAGGRVVAAGRPDAVLQPERLQAVYGVTVSVERHRRLGHLVVLPEALAEVLAEPDGSGEAARRAESVG